MPNWNEIFSQILPKILSLIGNEGAKEIAKPVEQIPVKIDPSAQPIVSTIDWSNPKSKINTRFSVHEATWLPSWGIYHQPTEEQKAAIIEIANGISKAIDIVEQKAGKHIPVNVHAWMRPDKSICPGSKWDGQDYNRYIYETQVWKDLTAAQKAEKKVPLSPHRTGHAVDFHLSGFEGNSGCDQVRAILEPHLEELGLRMEDISKFSSRGWVHLDNMPVINKRFFIP